MFDEKKARRVIRFIECLKHTKGEFHGKPFKLLPWQEKIIRDVFGTVRDEEPSMRQYNQVYIEIGKKNGKSELGAALALNMLINDEWKAEVYNARKSQFLRNGDVWATESLFLFAVLWLAFLPDQSETGVAGGGKARRPETPAAPRRPAQRPRPAPGFCAASANARPGDPAPVRLLEKALWVPPTTEPFRPAPSGKPERKKERRNPG